MRRSLFFSRDVVEQDYWRNIPVTLKIGLRSVAVLAAYLTVKLVLLVAMPPLVVTAILPVVAPLGTVAVIRVSELTVKLADVPLKVTLVVCVRAVPTIVTGVPTGPLGGENEETVGATLNWRELVSLVAPVTTVTLPVSAPGGTVAKMKVVPVSTAVVALVPPNFTTDELLNPWPRIPIWAPSLPELGCV